MKKIAFLVALIVTSLSINAQNEASNWYFGDNSGIRFNPDGSITPLTGSLGTDEGCTSISDANGNLLFYTDGSSVFDRNNNIMPNGFGLFGDSSSTQSALIVPKPEDPNIYYIFTVDTVFFGDPDFGFNYSVVDLTLNNGLGDVTQKNINLLQNSSEKLSAVLKDCESQSIWVVTFSNEFGTPRPQNSPNSFNTFHAFEISNTGVNTNAVKSTLSINVSDQRGYLKFSPDGTKLACANSNDGLYVFDFDTDTGVVSSTSTIPITLNIPSNNSAIFPYGVEFSQSGQFLYVSSSNNFFAFNDNAANNNPVNHFSSLVQFDVSAANIQSSVILLDQSQAYRSALQLGPDGKIYRTASATYNQGLPFLSVINNPNERGQLANYEENAIQLTNNSRQGLPPFITSFFTENIDIINNPEITSTFLPLCTGDRYTLSAEFIPNATYTWSFNDVVQPQQSQPNEFVVTQNGLYNVLIELNNGDCETFEGEAFVTYYDIPVANTLTDLNVCDTDNNGVLSFDFTTKDFEALGNQDANQFSVHYFSTLDDANANLRELSFPYENISNPQEIFVRVDNNGNANCYDINSFMLTVFDTPVIERIEEIKLCDLEGDTTDGIITTTLSDLEQAIAGVQDMTQISISFHPTENDAINNGISLPNLYQNKPFNDTIFIRVENITNTDCFSVDSLSITVSLNPEVNDIELLQCDEDGIPDGKTIFNILEKEEDITGGNPNLNVTYYTDMVSAISESGAIDAASYINESNPQNIVSKITDTSTGCFTYGNVLLEVSVTSANNAYLGICDTDGVEDGFMEFNLSNADSQVLDGLPGGLDLTYYETLENALLEESPLPNNYTNEVVNNQIIFARVENNNNCYGINEVELEVLTLPNVEVEFETLYCLNNFPEPIILNGGVIDDVPNNYFYDWSTGETTNQIEVNEPGIYTVTVSSVFGCSKERTITVLASNIATINDIEVTDTSENNTITILVSGEGNYEFALNNPNDLYQQSNIFENVRPGIYTVFVRDINDCGIAEELVSVVGFPKFFTPNGDSQNDFWQVKGISSQFQPNTVIYIFDRYGKLLSQINPTGSGWDGTYNGSRMPSDDYWFSVTLQDGRQFSSHFTLKR